MSDEHVQNMPVSFPVISSRALSQRRSAFSSDYAGLSHSHVMSIPEAKMTAARRSRRPAVIEDSLQLLDDLTNRPVDPLFEDATLLKGRPQSTAVKVTSKIVTFLMCIVVGMGTIIAIQELNKDTRQKVREALASQLTTTYSNSEKLGKDVDGLKTQVNTLSDELAGEAAGDSTATFDALTNGTTAISGPGVVVSLADPRESEADQGSTAREGTLSRIKVVTDTDLQRIVSILWSGGAEGVAVNGVRLGVQSSVRTAGSSILVGVTPIQTPYTVSAIGDTAQLEGALQSGATKSFFATLGEQGIYPSSSAKSSIKLDAAGQPEVDHAQKEQ
ncbi:MAG: DUF881 domain-containing protein [Bifidobacteriaceae bacterium]|jgi:uncharacterized protein YlxW (UPF0749 family)|nr:DUF881 domain-containing protein [Bifidobacteriaceae bacterium]